MQPVPPPENPPSWMDNLTPEELARLQKAMGDTNLDGKVSAEELEAALGDSKSTAVDWYFDIFLRADLIEKAALREAAHIASQNDCNTQQDLIAQAAQQYRLVTATISNHQAHYSNESLLSLEEAAEFYASKKHEQDLPIVASGETHEERKELFESLELGRQSTHHAVLEAMKGISVITKGIDIPENISEIMGLDRATIQEIATIRLHEGCEKQQAEKATRQSSTLRV